MPRRPLARVEIPSIVQRLGHCREAMLELSSGSVPRSMTKAVADQMISNIDELAWILTGDKEYFHDRAHGSAYRP